MRARDFLWAVGICIGLTLLFHYRPLWDARRFVQRDSQLGFEQAYEGHRWINGQLVSGAAAAGKWDPMAAAVIARSLHFEAEEVSWKGDHAAFVVRHMVRLQDGSPSGYAASCEIHVELERQGGRWQYRRFQVRGRNPLELPAEGNPWAQALRARGGGSTALPEPEDAG